MSSSAMGSKYASIKIRMVLTSWSISFLPLHVRPLPHYTRKTVCRCASSYSRVGPRGTDSECRTVDNTRTASDRVAHCSSSRLQRSRESGEAPSHSHGQPGNASNLTWPMLAHDQCAFPPRLPDAERAPVSTDYREQAGENQTRPILWPARVIPLRDYFERIQHWRWRSECRYQNSLLAYPYLYSKGNKMFSRPSSKKLLFLPSATRFQAPRLAYRRLRQSVRVSARAAHDAKPWFLEETISDQAKQISTAARVSAPQSFAWKTLALCI